ncbi:hypothetical protein O181_000421 [Austropuccinia psidii MF-1]|uniref:Uncharacterized protein n=1 Tax=Austropuccinia psidii MF-1 TaxID=1389203 RepID=A0A9Q3GBK8_9BASI|nr:hypothetical protein [Austropuccinia psidii MF-1]
MEYVQTQSPMSPNIPLETHIVSSLNLSSLKIDVGNSTAQTTSAWKIPNISVAPNSPNPTDSQIHVSDGPQSIQKTSSKANPHSNFLCDFLPNPMVILWSPRDPLGKLNGNHSIFHWDLRLMWDMKRVDGGKLKENWKILLELPFQGET